MPRPRSALRWFSFGSSQEFLFGHDCSINPLFLVFKIVYNRKMKGKKQLRAVQKATPSPERSPEAPSIALQIAEKIEEDVVLGRRHPRERLIEQDLSNDFETHRGDVRL